MSRVIARNRLGNTTEDIASMTSGTFAQFVAVMDGYDVLAVPSSSKVQGSTRKLFDVRGLGIKAAPRGIAYLASENLLIVNDITQPSTLFLTRTGQLVRTIDLSQTGNRSVVALTFFNPQHPSGGQFLIVDGPLAGDPITDIAFVTDFNGTPLNKIDYRAELGVLAPADVATITTGKNAGALSIVDRSSNELVVFELDSQ